MKFGRRLALPFLSIALACSSSSPTSSNGGHPPAGATVVTISDFMFSPASVSIKVGQAVSWTNKGPSVHTTTSDTGVWDSGQLSASGGSFTMTFNTPGTYPYHCMNHPPSIYPNFTGTITVTQ